MQHFTSIIFYDYYSKWDTFLCFYTNINRTISYQCNIKHTLKSSNNHLVHLTLACCDFHVAYLPSLPVIFMMYVSYTFEAIRMRKDWKEKVLSKVWRVVRWRWRTQVNRLVTSLGEKGEKGYLQLSIPSTS